MEEFRLKEEGKYHSQWKIALKSYMEDTGTVDFLQDFSDIFDLLNSVNSK